ncbi:MAG: hypothetical protein IT342_20805 [Candidatus Melainabacteria bacterium]|nr:hypothetical protein [Candidatus Melainabacteria bacterium]
MTGKESPLSDIYTLLGVSQMSPMEGVRTQFYKLTRRIHRELATAVDLDQRKKLLYDLKFICIAYDILSDPVTRTDYDLRTMGLRGVAMPQTPEEKKPGELGQRLHLKIGELLNVAGLLETSELEIACDMHKAMPEMQFGSFLVKQGFIEEYQLEAVLFAQKLLRKGLITIVQYQAAMEELESSGVSVSETVVERGYVTQSDLDHLEEVEAEAEAELNRPATAPVYTQPPLQEKPVDQVTSHSNLLAQMLPPGASDAVSARTGGNGEKSAGMLHKLLSGAQDGDITAPPSTMGGLLKGKGTISSGAAAAAEAVSAADAYAAVETSSPPGNPPPEAKDHKEPREHKEHKEQKEQKESGRKKKNIELHEVPAAFDPNLSRGVNDIASDTYEGAAYKDELLKPEDIKDTDELSQPAESHLAADQDNFISRQDGLLTADESESNEPYSEIMSAAQSDSASGDEFGLIDAGTSGVEFQGFVDSDERAAGTDEDENEEDEDEDEEDEGNITLIDADGTQLVEASLPPSEVEREAQVRVGSKNKTSDATHERIPAYTWPDSPLMTGDAAGATTSPRAEIGQDSADNESKIPNSSKVDPSLVTTRDRIPAFRPPLHNTFQLDEEATQQGGEPKPEGEGDSGERQLVISNAVPSWKDQLDWTAPEEEEEARKQQQPPTASQESEPIVDISRHLDLEAIEPQNKDDGDDELKSFLGKEYKEDLTELNESGRPLWDVEDDEFIVPSSQKKNAQHAKEEEERQQKEKKTSGGWQRLKNPFELQIGTGGSSGQITGEEAVVEVPEQEALDISRSITAEFLRPDFLREDQSAEAAGAAASSTDSFIEPNDSLAAGEDSFQASLQASSNPQIVIGLEDADHCGEVEAEEKFVAFGESAKTGSSTAEELIIEEPLSKKTSPKDSSMEHQSIHEPPALEKNIEVEEAIVDKKTIEESVIEESTIEPAVAEGAIVEESVIEEAALDDAAAAEPVLQESVEVETVVVEPFAETLSEEAILEEESAVDTVDEAVVAAEATGDEESAAEEATEDRSKAEDVSTPARNDEVAQPALADDKEQPADTAEQEVTLTSGDNGAVAQDADDDTTGDDKAAASAAGAAEETPLERRRRMLGRRHHKGKP